MVIINQKAHAEHQALYYFNLFYSILLFNFSGFLHKFFFVIDKGVRGWPLLLIFIIHFQFYTFSPSFNDFTVIDITKVGVHNSMYNCIVINIRFGDTNC